MSVEFFELRKVQMISTSGYVFPDVFAVAGLESAFEELVHDGFESIEIDVFVAVLCHVSECLVC